MFYRTQTAYRFQVNARRKLKLTKYLESKETHAARRARTSYVMDLDHQTPKDKKFNLSDAGRSSTETVLAEIAKCDAVCANCHRERTHGKYKNKN